MASEPNEDESSRRSARSNKGKPPARYNYDKPSSEDDDDEYDTSIDDTETIKVGGSSKKKASKGMEMILHQLRDMQSQLNNARLTQENEIKERQKFTNGIVQLMNRPSSQDQPLPCSLSQQSTQSSSLTMPTSSVMSSMVPTSSVMPSMAPSSSHMPSIVPPLSVMPSMVPLSSLLPLNKLPPSCLPSVTLSSSFLKPQSLPPSSVPPYIASNASRSAMTNNVWSAQYNEKPNCNEIKSLNSAIYSYPNVMPSRLPYQDHMLFSHPPQLPVSGISSVNNMVQQNYLPLNNAHSSVHAREQQFVSQNNHAIGNAARHKLHDLPEFSGKPEEWPKFIASYRESTAAFNYSNLENLIRLQKCLRGDAKLSVESMLIFPDNVNGALEQLEFLYGRPECLIKSQLEQVRRILPIDEKHLQMIIPFATKIRNLSTFLQTTNSIYHLANPMLIEELVGKLPMSLRIEWAKYSQPVQPYATVTQLSDWINEQARVISKVVVTTTPSESKFGQKKNPVLHLTENQPESKSVRCSYCEKSHVLSDCSKFMNLKLEDRWAFVKNKRLCFSCIKYGHSTFNCRNRKPCKEDGCRKNHHKLLHDQNHSQSTNNQSSPQQFNEKTGNEVQLNEKIESRVYSCSSTTFIPPKSVLFKIVPVEIFGPNKSVSTYAFIDEGSSVTLMEEELANELQLSGFDDGLNLQWLGDVTSSQPSKLIQSVDIRGVSANCKKVCLKNVRTIKNMQLPSQSLHLEKLNQRFHHVKGLPVADYVEAKPSILIGVDNCQICLPYNVRFAKNNDPIAIKTKLGWVVYGNTMNETHNAKFNAMFHIQADQQCDEKLTELHQIVKDYFTTENFGVMTPVKEIHSNSDSRALSILNSTTIRVNDRYETGLLWRTDDVKFPDSLSMATRRFALIEKKMNKDPEYARLYVENMRNYFEKGYARKLKPDEVRNNTERTWYLPHFGVKNPSKPNKLRIVFDAAASINGISLNSMLLQGPDQYQPLISILFRFRQSPVAVCGDIREMFSQIRIRMRDRDCQRFLWRENQVEPVNVCVMNSMIFGASCSPCSAQFVKNKNASLFAQTDPVAVNAIIKNHYVDDFVQSFENESEALEVTKSIVKIHKFGGFELCKFVSNSKNVEIELNGQNENKESLQAVNLNMIENATDKILGIHWDTMSDEFKFKLKFNKIHEDVLKSIRPPTKRELLSMIMSIFDPFGMIANFVIYSKILLQDLWKAGVAWDDLVPENVQNRWLSWFREFENVKQFRLRRNYTPNFMSANEVQLHIFVDASQSAFAAVAYVRVLSDEGVEIAFVCGKTKCAPQKMLSIPRLELQSAVLGVRLKNMIEEAHDCKFKSCTYWSDSSTVIQWIRADHRRYKPFVAHRVAEILECSDVKEWRWISTKLNPADEATRAMEPPKFIVDNRWLMGPPFLLNSDDNWPEDIHVSEVESSGDDEMRSKCVLHMKIKDFDNSSKDFDEMIQNCSRYNNLKRRVAWIKRFIRNYLSKRSEDRQIGELSVDETNAAELLLCRHVQNKMFGLEFELLQKGNSVEKTSCIYNLSPCLADDGVIRLSGRIDNAVGVEKSVQRPIILPTKHHLSFLIVDYYHKQMKHVNQEAVICEVRQKFWIPHLRGLVKKVKRECQVCKNQSAKPLTPEMGQLPPDRLTPFIRPFSYTGLDYFGPINVSIGRRREKRWVALFTCMTIRAVHVELAKDLSTDACIICIRNFINRRGVPVRIRSDNGTNFVGTDNELRNLNDFLDNDRIIGELTSRNIEWVFNSPAFPNAGGCWERLVQSIKRVLKFTLKEVVPQIETLQSLLIEAENIINSRPLTHIPVESDENDPLTPNHFLIGTMNSTQTPGVFDDKLFRYKKQWRIAQQMKNCFWHRWVAEYLPTLTRRTKWFEKVEPIKEDDLVLICDENLPRSQWLKGRVVKVFTSKNDSQVRQAEVRTNNGVLKRPASKLAVLDVVKSKSGAIYGGGMSVTVSNRVNESRHESSRTNNVAKQR